MTADSYHAAAAQVSEDYVETPSHLLRGLRVYDDPPPVSLDDRHAIPTASEVAATAPLHSVSEEITVPRRLFAVHPPDAGEAHQRQGPVYLLIVLVVPHTEYDALPAAKQSLDHATRRVEMMVRTNRNMTSDRLNYLQEYALERIAVDCPDEQRPHQHSHVGHVLDWLRRAFPGGNP